MVGPSVTPRANFAGGSATPRSGHSYSSGGGRPPDGGSRREGSMLPPPSPAGSGRSAHKRKGGDLWGATAESWSNNSRRTPGQGKGGK